MEFAILDCFAMNSLVIPYVQTEVRTNKHLLNIITPRRIFRMKISADSYHLPCCSLVVQSITILRFLVVNILTFCPCPLSLPTTKGVNQPCSSDDFCVGGNVCSESKKICLPDPSSTTATSETTPTPAPSGDGGGGKAATCPFF